MCVSFGRSLFLIYDTKLMRCIIDNSATQVARIKAAQIIVDNKANVLLTPDVDKMPRM